MPITDVLETKGNGMLVLSRHKHEQIVIGDNVTITVIDVRGDKVRIGIDAPKHVPVHRLEVAKAIQQSNAVQPPTPHDVLQQTPAEGVA